MPELIDIAKPLITSTKDISERRLRLHKLNSSLLNVQHLINLERLERIQRLESLERIQQLESLENIYTDNITSYNKDYKDLEIPQGALIYCDPPYDNSAENYGGFNTEEFLDWCVEKSKTNPIYISEYNISDPRFTCIAETKRLVTASAKTSVNKIEKLYTVI